MIFADINCDCGACYSRAESTTLKGASGHFTCSACGELIESWDEPKKRAYRLVIAPERMYAHPNPPPSP